MKCIKNIKTGQIERVTDKEAYNTVGSTWSFVAKTEWKAATRKVKAVEVLKENETESETIAEKQLKRKKGVKNEKAK
jgi:hypothetical protein